MRPTALKTLTWATVAAAVASALWLAAVESEPAAAAASERSHETNAPARQPAPSR